MQLTGPWLALIGLLIGIFGTMIGAGGGFLLIPILLLAFPADPPEVVTAISLAVIFCNSLSGSIAYARKGRIDYRSAWIFALVSLPGAVLGVFVNGLVAREIYEPLFGLGLIFMALYLIIRKSQVSQGRWGQPTARRDFADREGHRYRYEFNQRLAVSLSAGVGFVSSFLGIGGGILHVPAMVHLLNFPVHVATATSHLILVAMSLTATVQHALVGSLQPGLDRLVWLAPAVVLGAPVGARLSEFVKGTWILRSLAFALLLVGARLLL